MFYNILNKSYMNRVVDSIYTDHKNKTKQNKTIQQLTIFLQINKTKRKATKQKQISCQLLSTSVNWGVDSISPDHQKQNKTITMNYYLKNVLKKWNQQPKEMCLAGPHWRPVHHLLYETPYKHQNQTVIVLFSRYLHRPTLKNTTDGILCEQPLNLLLAAYLYL